MDFLNAVHLAEREVVPLLYVLGMVPLEVEEELDVDLASILSLVSSLAFFCFEHMARDFSRLASLDSPWNIAQDFSRLLVEYWSRMAARGFSRQD